MKTNWLLLPNILIWFCMFLIGCGNKKTKETGGLQVPQGFTIEQVASSDLLSYPMFATFDSQGRLFVFESTEPNTMSTKTMREDPTYDIRLLEDTDGDGTFDKSTIYADQIPFPMGGTFHDGSLYAAAPPNLLKFTDVNRDGKAEKRDTLLTGWTLYHNGAILSGPFMGPDGWLYMADARRGYSIQTKEGDTLKGKGARIWRCLPDGSRLEWVSAGGFDNSVEIAFMPAGETIGTMTYFTNPQNGQRDALMHWVEGGVYPKPNPVIEEDSLKLTGDLMPVMDKLPRVAPSGLMRYKGSFWGKEYQGNLFSAIFNTGEIKRSIINKDGATYATKDESFVTSTKPDIHPTDVLEDADGSLLVVVTGGWFIEGCPLSRVAKPNVKGGIYRIKKTESQKTKDPWGRSINFSDMSAKKLTGLFSDSRPRVRKKAIEAVVQKGAASVDALQSLFSSSDDKVRVAAIFALYRIKSGDALEAARSGLTDQSALVRDASVRVAGLAKNKKAVEKLKELVQKDPAPAVRRQAATALGQIGDKDAVGALLRAAADVQDRFIEHAIIHSLIIMNHPNPLIDALKDPSNNTRKAALIALDQMDSSPLTRAQLFPFLSSRSEELRDVGVWVASHRPSWSDIISNFIETNIGSTELSAEEITSFRKLMITFCGSKNLQGLLGKKLTAPETPVKTKLLLIDVMGQCDMSKSPPFWVSQLGKVLTFGSDEVRTAVLSLIASRGMAGLDEKLQQIINNPKDSAEFRLQAIRARMGSHPKLSEKEFKIAINYLDKSNDSPTRQSAARLLSRAKLNEQQLLVIARKQLPQADLFLLPNLIEIFKGSHNQSKEVGLALVKALKTSSGRLDNVSQQDLQDLINTYPKSVQVAAGSLMKEIEKKQSERLTKLREIQKQLGKGDVGEGRKLFFGKATCSTCHSVGGEGGTLGPDLSNIGEIRSRHDLLEAIVYPSASFARGYQIYKVTTASNTYIGVIDTKTSSAVILNIGPRQKIRIPRSKITSIKPHNVSLMPPGLNKQLSKKELSDLIAFLEALPYKVDRLMKLQEKNE